MDVDDDVLMKNPFQFELAGVVVNDAVTREAVTKTDAKILNLYMMMWFIVNTMK